MDIDDVSCAEHRLGCSDAIAQSLQGPDRLGRRKPEITEPLLDDADPVESVPDQVPAVHLQDDVLLVADKKPEDCSHAASIEGHPTKFLSQRPPTEGIDETNDHRWVARAEKGVLQRRRPRLDRVAHNGFAAAHIHHRRVIRNSDPETAGGWHERKLPVQTRGKAIRDAKATATSSVSNSPLCSIVPRTSPLTPPSVRSAQRA